ncbi:MCE family protein [Nocardioides flavescens]|uniref:MCE family protein n=1 Tax=Nocardioides flavescens TaxID=2691959 RepID=A0A6L7F0V5_9ACTN|nr:MCE family protein [Nocardioides flavescens]MXG90251.1 MCE family protein [Nocardioides flavescens]
MNAVLRQVKLLGVVFLVLVLAAVYLTYAAFTKKFASYEVIEVKASTTGLQLPSRADVKIRGVQVGEVLSTEATSDGATIEVGLYPEDTREIPANVSASIVPKTLFGEKYVSLIIPSDPATKPIQAGAVIQRTQVATEVEQVLNDLYPLLESIDPAQLNATLTALSTALEGRGDQLGQNLQTLDAYLTKLNPELPALVEDLRLASQVSDIYADVLPEIGNVLQNTVTTTTTLETREQKLNALLNDVSAFSDTARGFLDTNEDNLVSLGQLTEQTATVLARYSSEFPCLLGGLVNGGKRQAEAFRNFTLHIVLETIPNQPRGYTPADTPVLGDDRGPNCLDLPSPPGTQENPFTDIPNFNDGINSPTGKGTSRVGTAYAPTDGSVAPQVAAGDQLGGFGGYAGSPEETAVLSELLAPGLGTSADDVPDLGGLLLGPAVRGATVSIGDGGETP